MSSDVIAGLFPGQGSQTGDLRSQVARDAPELLELCVDLVGEDPFARVTESTRLAQPAIFCASVAGWMRLREHVRPVAFAGHSLGELSALVAAEALDPADGLALAVRRGELMAAAGDGEEGMLAVLGSAPDLPARLAEDHGVVVANDNAPGQVVLAGRLERLHEARDAAREQGARAIMLDVAGAVAPFRAALEQVQLREPVVPVICGWSARPFDDVREELAAAIVQPVRWRSTMLALATLGADEFVDFGPGSVLAKLVRRNLPAARAIDPDELAAPVAVGAGDGA